jgi:CheY-like chemotaxis protein
MAPIDAATLLDHAILLGLISRGQARDARNEAESGEIEAISRALTRKGLLTSWQLERLKKGDSSGFFFCGCMVLFHLAEGTFARVYRGVHVDSQKPIAVKVLRRRFANDPESVRRFNKEAEEGMKLRHPNIVQILDHGEQDRQHYMIMEYVEGSNILVSSNGVAKLVDFGLATIEGDDKKASVNMRTVDYSALERTCKSEKGDLRSDIFFLGCVFYQMLTGQPPMPETETKDMLAKMLKRSFGAIKPLADQQYAPAPETTRIIEKMMKVDLKARYQTVDEVIADLESQQGRLSSAEHPAVTDELSFDDESIFLHPFRRDAADDEPKEAAPPPPPPKNVLCVESQAEIQDALRKTLTRMGYRVLLVGDPERAAERFREEPPDALIFDADGLGPDAVDAFRDMHDKAHEDGHALAALVLLGPRQLALRGKLPTDDRLVVLSKPLKMKEVQDAIAQLVPIAAPAGGTVAT